MLYVDRADAGRALARDLEHLAPKHPLVLALPRGGVPVAAEIASALGTDLDVVPVRKLGVPRQPELAMGAIGENGITVLNEQVIDRLKIRPRDIERVRASEQIELDRRANRWRRRDPIPRRGRLVLMVDDGMATGATMEAACRVVTAEGASEVVVAVPVASPEAVERIRALGIDVRCRVDARLGGVGAAYSDFHQLGDAEVAKLLT